MNEFHFYDPNLRCTLFKYFSLKYIICILFWAKGGYFMNSELVMKAVKLSLKSKGISYKKLAEHLEMSEAGVKRFMSAKDCSVSKLMKICQVLDISPQDIFANSDALKTEHLEFSQKQKDLFERDPKVLKYFYKLSVEGRSPLEIERLWGLSEKESKRIHLALEKVDLIELKNGFELVPFKRSRIRWAGLGRSIEKFKIDFAHDMLENFKNQSDFFQSGKFNVFHVYLTKNTRDELVKSWEESLTKALDQTSRELLLKKKKEISAYNITQMLAPMRGFESPHSVTRK